MKKFDYKIITISVAHLKKRGFQSELNQRFQEWGDEGWDLVKMEPISSGGVVFQGNNTDEFLAVFKREKPE